MHRGGLARMAIRRGPPRDILWSTDDHASHLVARLLTACVGPCHLRVVAYKGPIPKRRGYRLAERTSQLNPAWPDVGPRSCACVILEARKGLNVIKFQPGRGALQPYRRIMSRSRARAESWLKNMTCTQQGRRRVWPGPEHVSDRE